VALRTRTPGVCGAAMARRSSSMRSLTWLGVGLVSGSGLWLGLGLDEVAHGDDGERALGEAVLRAGLGRSLQRVDDARLLQVSGVRRRLEVGGRT